MGDSNERFFERFERSTPPGPVEQELQTLQDGPGITAQSGMPGPFADSPELTAQYRLAEHDEASAKWEADEAAPLPLTESDYRWQVMHDGHIEVLRAPDAGEVLKIYRDSRAPDRPALLRTPSGIEVPVAGSDIVQAFTRAAHVADAQRADEVFQGWLDLPKGYSVSVPEPDVAAVVPYAVPEDAEITGPETLLGIDSARSAMLGGLAMVASTLKTAIESRGGFGTIKDSRQVVEVPAGPRYEVLIHYPFYIGSQVRVITPSGRLVKGNAADIVDLATRDPAIGAERLRRMRLGTLAREKEYIPL